MSATLYGYMRSDCGVAAHEISDASDVQLARTLTWVPHDWRDDPEWPCVAIGTLRIERIALAEFVPQQIELLRKQQKELLAAAQAAAVEIDRQINNLLAIEHAS
jgi:hypothetical protein